MFIQCSGCSVPLQHSVSLQEPQYPSCQSYAGTHLRNFQGKSDLSLQSHLGFGTSNLSLEFFLFLNCCFALVSLPCHCPLRSGLDSLTEHCTLITHNSPNGSDLLWSLLEWEHLKVCFLGFFLLEENGGAHTQLKKLLPPSIWTDGWSDSYSFAYSQTVIFKYSSSFQEMYNIMCLGSLSFVYSEKLPVLKSLHQSLNLFLSYNLAVNLHS